MILILLDFQLVFHTTVNLEVSDDEFITPISEAVKTSLKCKHADYPNAEYIVSSEVDEADNDGYNDTGSPQQTKKTPHVTAMVCLLV